MCLLWLKRIIYALNSNGNIVTIIHTNALTNNILKIKFILMNFVYVYGR